MPPHMIGSHPFAQGRVLVEDSVLSGLEPYRQRRRRDFEAGGLLLGFRRGPHLHITQFTHPYASDQRTPISFRRARTGHARCAHERWLASGKTMDYVGEWHTHPQIHPSPSNIDWREWQKILSARTNAMVFLVLGTSSDWLGIGLRDEIERVYPEHVK